MKLKSADINNREWILDVFICKMSLPHKPAAYFEHDQWWVECLDCGAQWSVNDAEDIYGEFYFEFEQVSEGDDFCIGKEEMK